MDEEGEGEGEGGRLEGARAGTRTTPVVQGQRWRLPLGFDVGAVS
jgi:hypothetical protein